MFDLPALFLNIHYVQMKIQNKKSHPKILNRYNSFAEFMENKLKSHHLGPENCPLTNHCACGTEMQ